MSLNLTPLPETKPLNRFRGQRIVDVRPDPDGGFPVLVSEAGDALILIDWRQGKASWQPTEKAQQLYRPRPRRERRRRRNHA